MKVYSFHNKKYGRDLLIDLGKFKKTPQFDLSSTPHTVDFYEIFFFRKAKGEL